MCLSGQVHDGELRGRVDLQRSATAVRLRSADEQLFRVDCGVSRPETKMYQSGGSGAGTKLKMFKDARRCFAHDPHQSTPSSIRMIHQGGNIRPRTLGRQSTTTKADQKKRKVGTKQSNISMKVESPSSPSLHYLVCASLAVLHAGFHLNSFIPREGRHVVLLAFLRRRVVGRTQDARALLDCAVLLVWLFGDFAPSQMVHTAFTWGNRICHTFVIIAGSKASFCHWNKRNSSMPPGKPTYVVYALVSTTKLGPKHAFVNNDNGKRTHAQPSIPTLDSN